MTFISRKKTEFKTSITSQKKNQPCIFPIAKGLGEYIYHVLISTHFVHFLSIFVPLAPAPKNKEIK